MHHNTTFHVNALLLKFYLFCLFLICIGLRKLCNDNDLRCMVIAVHSSQQQITVIASSCHAGRGSKRVGWGFNGRERDGAEQA